MLRQLRVLEDSHRREGWPGRYRALKVRLIRRQLRKLLVEN